MTSKLPSSLKNFNEVTISGKIVTSSKNINVLPSINLLLGSNKEIFLIIEEALYPL